MRTILILCLSILFLPLTLAAEGLTVAGGTENTDYSYTDNVYTVLTGTALTFSGITTTDRIVVKEGVTADITLDNVDISFSDGGGDSGLVGTCAFYINDHAIVKLKIININSLQSGAKCAAIQVEKNASIEIDGEGTLNAQGGWGGAGIGAGAETSCGTIKIKNGTINALAGDWAFGLGGGCFLDMETSKDGIIIIDGGTITAKGDKWGSSSIMGNITISVSTITTGFHNHSNYKNNFNGDLTINGGTFTNWTLNNIVSFDETNCTFTNCNLSFKNTAILTKDYLGCTFNGNIVINGGTFTNCSISGDKVIINKGTINNTDGSRITSDEIIINGGNIKITIPQRENGIGIHSIETKKLIIYGGNIFIEGQSYRINSDMWGNQGGNAINATTSVEIYGGTINLSGGGRKESADYTSSGPGFAINSPKIIIDGGNLYAKCGSPWTASPFQGSTIKNHNNADIYLGITPEIANATDVSVDGIPYYISGNHPENDNKLYLYMTKATHEVAVRADDKITTYDVEYNLSGNDNDGYFTFNNKAESTPSKTSAITFEADDITATYNKESNDLTVTLTITETPTKSRSAAMNSVQLTLMDGANTYYSNHQTVNGSGKYEFTFDTQGLKVGEYTLTANYGGSTTSLTADEQTATLTIEKADGSMASNYIEPNALLAIYGETLADVILPEGWAWNDDLTTSVGNVISSPNTFAATFTPADTKNYNTIVKDLSVTVNKAMSGNVEEPKVTSPSSVTYGIMLSEITITDGWEWADETIVPIVNNSNYPVYYPVTDYTNYNWSWSSIYSETHHRLEYTVTVTVNKADPTAADFTFTAPSNLVYDGKGKQATVTAKDGLTGTGDITLKYYNEKREPVATPTEVGTYIVKIDVAGGDNYSLASDLTAPEWTFTILPKSNPPVNPPVNPDEPDEPDPAPVRYTVTLPTVEGAATDPAAGSYEVESWGSFSFLLTLGEGYQKDSHPVVTARGETLTPNASTGKYIIRNVQSDITVGITGIVKDIATGNEMLTDGFHITTSGGLLLVTVPRATRLYLTDTSGRLILTRLLPAGDTRIDDLAAGIYLLTLEGEKTKKIIIR